MAGTNDGSVIRRDATKWFRHRSYDYRQFSDFMHAVATPDGLKLQKYVEELVERPPFDDASEVDPGVSRTPAAALLSGDGLVKPRRGDVGGESASVKGVRDDPSSARQ